MKVLFVISPDIIPKKKFIKPKKKVGLYIPLSIAQISAVLEEQGHDIKVLDLRLSNNIFHDLFNSIKNSTPDLVGFTDSFFSAKITQDLTKELRKKFKGLIVLGGSYATVFAKNILKINKAIDIIVLDEADYTIGEILSSKNTSTKLNKINGIMFRKGKKIIETKSRPVIQNLDILPTPAFHLFDFNKYIPNPKHCKRTPIAPMITSRGCVYGKCSFCYQPRKYGKRQSPKKVVSQIVELHKKYGIKEVRFWDDVFLYNNKWINEFCELLEKENLDIIWACHARVDTVSKEMLLRVKKAGCWQVLYGLESANFNLLKNINKGTTKKQARNAVKWTKEVGIEVRVSCILGLPGETPELTDETINFAYQLDPDILQFSLITPYPGSKMYEQYKNSKQLDPNIKKYCEIKPVFLPKGYKNLKQLEKKYKQAYSNFYFKPKYLLGRILKIRTFDDIKRYYNGILMAINMSK